MSTIIAINAFELPPCMHPWVLLSGGLGSIVIARSLSHKFFDVFRSKSRFAYACQMTILKTYQVLFGLQHSVRGLENLPHGPKILTANHPNASDGLQLPLVLKDRVTVIAQESLFHLPFFGWILTHSGHIPVRPGDRRAAFDQACKALAEGKTILIFPEGTLNPENREVKAGTGAVRLTLATGVPIIPVGVQVARSDTLVIGPIGKFQSGRWQFRGKFKVRLGSAWTPGQETGPAQEPLEIQELTRCLMEKIYALVQQAAQEET